MQIFDKIIDSYREDMVQDIQSIVKIKSVKEEPKGNMPFGEGIQKSLEKALEIASRLGFNTENIDNYAGEASYGSGKESIAMLGHLDVVPEGKGWSFPPYGAEIHDGIIYGRGVSDNKGPAIMSLYAVKAIMESGLPIAKELKVIFGTDEESGMTDVKYYVDKKGEPTMAITPDAGFPLIHGEKGILTFTLKTDCNNHKLTEGITITSGIGGNAVNSVPDTCVVGLLCNDPNSVIKVLDSYKDKNEFDFSYSVNDKNVSLKTSGKSYHGSQPQNGENAVSYMFILLAAISKESDSNLAKFIRLYNNRIAFKHHGENIGCHFEDEKSGYLAFNPGIFSITEHGIEVKVNVRYPVTYTGDQVFSGVENNIKDTVVVLERGSDSAPMYVEPTSELVVTLMNIYKEQTGDIDAKPMVIGGGTYARKLSNAVAFGPGFPGNKSNAHQPDERFKIDDMIRATKIYAKALYKLAQEK